MPLQVIKRRIKSVSATRQMTKAMQMVASSKLRRAEANLAAPTSYLTAATAIAQDLGRNPLASQHKFYQPPATNANLTIIIGGDRGLAGAYNSNLYRQLSHAVDDGQASEQQIIAVGRRISHDLARFANLKLIATYAMDDGSAVTDLAAPIVMQVIQLYRDGKISQVSLIATRFESAIKQTATTTQILPRTTTPTANQTAAVLEPGITSLLEATITRLIEAEVASALAHARASEQAARMVAMMNATDNANDLASDLTLELNTVRQAHITQEIAEITTGAAALS